MRSQSPSLQRRAVRVRTLAMHAARRPLVCVSGLAAGRCARRAGRPQLCAHAPHAAQAAAVLPIAAGRLADRAQAALGWPRLRMRRLVQGAASLGARARACGVIMNTASKSERYWGAYLRNINYFGLRTLQSQVPGMAGHGASRAQGQAQLCSPARRHASGPQRTRAQSERPGRAAPQALRCACCRWRWRGAASARPRRWPASPARSRRHRCATRASTRTCWRARCRTVWCNRDCECGRPQPGRTPLCCAAVRAPMCLKARRRGGAAWAQSDVA